MSSPVLLNSNDPWFDFEHFNAHRNYLGAMFPLTRFSTLPYLLDPQINTNEPASAWHLRHQTAHKDAMETLPSFYRYSFYDVENPLFGLPMGPPVIDTNMDSPEQRAWFTWANLTEHLTADAALLPITGSTRYQFPFS